MCMAHLGYFGVFLALFLEAIGIPFPAETILVSAGIEMTRGFFAFLPLWLCGALGNIIGSQIAYAIGRFLGRPVILKYGRFVRITEARLQAVEVKFQKYQIPFMVIAKFIAFVRIAIPYLAGINKISYGKFNLFNTIAALAWSGLFILVGNTVDVIWKRYGGFLLSHLYITVPLVVVVVGLLYLHHRRSKRLLSKDIESSTHIPS
jgi:membrane protein DedA with SNARE-associated domain